MTDKQPKALMLADALLEPVVLDKHAMQAAAELRRLHSELEATDRQVNILTDALHNANEDAKRFREAASCEREVRRQLERHVDALEDQVKTLDLRCAQGYAIGRQSGREDCEALLRQALEALEYCRSGEDCHPTPGEVCTMTHGDSLGVCGTPLERKPGVPTRDGECAG